MTSMADLATSPVHTNDPRHHTTDTPYQLGLSMLLDTILHDGCLLQPNVDANMSLHATEVGW